MDVDQLKLLAAKKAVSFVKPNSILGVGTGSTVNHFIMQLASSNISLKAVVSSSKNSTKLLAKYNFNIIDLNQVDNLTLYIDGADEINSNLELIKGGGGALTREKIIASATNEFICIADSTKLVKTLGKFPLPIEVVPMATKLVIQTITNKFTCKAKLREDFITDNGNQIIDVTGLKIITPKKLEQELNQIAGVVTNGIFALRKADRVILAKDSGVELIQI